MVKSSTPCLIQQIKSLEMTYLQNQCHIHFHNDCIGNGFKHWCTVSVD